MNSALYVGRVLHTRFEPVEHHFEYRHFLLGLDLDELESSFDGRWLWSVERPNLASFRRRDCLAGSADLRTAVCERVERELGFRPAGRVVVLTQPRLAGLVFNPVTFYLCHEPAGELCAFVAEITNTPWNERHAYVCDARGGRRSVRARFDKRFHVSPFMPMDLEYVWSLERSDHGLSIDMLNLRAGRRIFEARLRLERRPLDGRNLARVLWSYPGFSLGTLAGIYWQALRLRLKGVPRFAHPRVREAS